MKLLDAGQLAEMTSSLGLEAENVFVYEATAGGQRLGTCIVDIQESLGTLRSVSTTEPGDWPIADGLIRAALSLMQRHGAETAVCSEGIEERLLKRVGFRRIDGVWQISLDENLFTSCGQ